MMVSLEAASAAALVAASADVAVVPVDATADAVASEHCF